MSNIPWFQIGQNVINLVQTADEYSVAKAKAKAMKKQQEYNNKMARISDAVNQNAITSNVSMAIQQSARQSQQIQQQGGAMRSAITTSAGATGTVGNSVEQTKLSVRAQEATAEYTRQENLRGMFMQADQQRRTSTLAADMQQDYSPIQMPNATAYLFDHLTSTSMGMLQSSFTDTEPAEPKAYGGGKGGGVNSGTSAFANWGLVRGAGSSGTNWWGNWSSMAGGF